MSTLKSSAEDLTLNADGSGNDIKFQSNAVEVGSLTAEGVLTVTSSEPKIHLADTDASASGYAKIRGGASGAVFLEADPTDAEVSSHITFKVDNTQMGRFTTDGLCFNSDSAAANALDDYEEGTWTPTVVCSTSGSYTVDTGANVLAYTKVGRVVHIQGGVNIASVSSPNGNIRMSLPFTPFSGTKDSDYCMGNAMLTNHGGSLPNNADLFISGADYASLFSVADDGGTQYLDHDDVDTAFTIIFSMTYIAS